MNILWIILPLMVTWSSIGAIIILDKEPSLSVILFGGFVSIVTMIVVLPYVDFGSPVINKSPITLEINGCEELK